MVAVLDRNAVGLIFEWLYEAGIDIAEGDTVDGDMITAPFSGQCFRHANNSSLCAGIGHLCCRTVDAGN